VNRGEYPRRTGRRDFRESPLPKDAADEEGAGIARLFADRVSLRFTEKKGGQIRTGAARDYDPGGRWVRWIGKADARHTADHVR